VPEADSLVGLTGNLGDAPKNPGSALIGLDRARENPARATAHLNCERGDLDQAVENFVCAKKHPSLIGAMRAGALPGATARSDAKTLMEGESIHGVRGQPDFTSKPRFASSAFSATVFILLVRQNPVSSLVTRQFRLVFDAKEAAKLTL
jgi:hypothetical protein